MAPKIRALARQYPVVSVTGPRQSGKTTLVRAVFERLPYVSLENPDAREFAERDPRRFLARHRDGVVLDEVQRVPGLLSYLQSDVDEDSRPGRFILTGSSNLLLLERVTQSLAGRVALLTLLPFSLGELQDAGTSPRKLDDLLHAGLYPPLHGRKRDPTEWYANYVTTFLERDVRAVLNVADLSRFQLFLRLCAARSAQLLNLSDLGAHCGVSHNTARSWLSVLEATYVVRLLRPHHVNLTKRLVKSPKLHFLDPGLLCYLLGIHRPEELEIHSSRGAVFESWVCSELLKHPLNLGRPPAIHFWRDHVGHEIDFLVGTPPHATPIETKSGATVANDWFKALRYWAGLVGATAGDGWVVYGGNESQTRSDAQVVAWSEIDMFLESLRTTGPAGPSRSRRSHGSRSDTTRQAGASRKRTGLPR